MGKDAPAAPLSLDAVRARIDAVDAELLRLIGERASLAGAVATAK
ncbi:MAG: chorismate mutase, partial [Pseudomonadota bacterium]